MIANSLIHVGINSMTGLFQDLAQGGANGLLKI